MPKTTRAKLVRLYYELCVVPAMEPRLIHSWADMISRLLSNKSGLRQKLEPTDLQLNWSPLWRVLMKEIWPKKRLQFPITMNIINRLVLDEM
jgi:proteasome activator subunit 4